MKNLIKSLLIILAFVGTANAQKIVVKGSDTVLPLSQKEAEDYMKANKGSTITVVGGGSGVGIAALMDGTTDIAMSSRKIKMDERMTGKAYKEIIIAQDALAVIVNPGNTVSQLTREQLEGIFTGKITNWKDVGGADMKIICYARETSSGTYEFFKEHVMNRKNYASACLNSPATGAIIESVSSTKGAIGYVGLAYLEKDVKAIGVSYDKGKTFVKPTVAAAKDKSYPVVRPLYYYYNTRSEKNVKPFLDFVLSATGQQIVEKVGYIAK
jgi:phosphate transport system substrate-binding protein